MNAVAELINKQNFSEANELIQNIGLVKFMNGLLEKAFDDESIDSYTFVKGWLIEEETYDKHILAINLLFHPLCHIEEHINLHFIMLKDVWNCQKVMI